MDSLKEKKRANAKAKAAVPIDDLLSIDKTLREHVNVETLSKDYVDQPAVTFCSSDGKYVKEVTVRGKLYYIFMS